MADPVQLEDIPVGYQDIYEGTADGAIEDPKIEDITGDANQRIELADPAPKTVRMTVMGDGAIGPNVFASIVDGRIGEGKVEIRTEFKYSVISPDATTISWTKKSREKIPV